MLTEAQPFSSKSNIMYRPLGMRLSVLRNARWEREGTDCTNDGVTRVFEELLLIGTVQLAVRSDNGQNMVKPLPRSMRVFPLFLNPTSSQDTMRLTTGDITPVALHPGHAAGAAFLAPVEWSERGQCWTAPRGMAGGNYAATSDSRVRELVEQVAGHQFYGALSVHDRFEF